MIIRLVLLVLMLAGFAAPNAGQNTTPGRASFDFTRTMRVDYVHTGGPTSGETVDAVGEGGVRAPQPRHPGAAARDPQAQRARRGDGCALP
jgi:hypothetical protein